MLKKLSLLFAVVTLCANMGIIAPVSAQAATEETVLVESNFQNCNLGTYTAENQKAGETDLRNGVVMNNDSNLSTGYTMENGESISEADIVIDSEGKKALRLSTFLNTPYEWGKANYPVVKTIGQLPGSGKVKIDIEVKTSPRVSFWMFHSNTTQVKQRFWRLENGGGSASNIKVLDNTQIQGIQAECTKYYTYTVIMDIATGKLDFYLNGELKHTDKGYGPTDDKELFFAQLSNNAATYAPVVEYAEEGSKVIKSITNPQYVYVRSLKMTTYTDTAIESVTPAEGSSVWEPEEAVFTFNKEIKSVKKAEVYVDNSAEAVDVTSSLICDGNTVKVPYAFEGEKNYKVTLTGASDGLTTTDASTSFKTEWNFSNIIKNPVSASPEDNNKYFINEDFTNSDNNNIISADGWTIKNSDSGTIAQLEDGNKVYQVETASEATFQLDYKQKGDFDDTTTLSFDLYREADTRNFIIERNDYTTGNVYPIAASWFKGFCNGKELTHGKWHKMLVAFSDTTGTSVYVDGTLVIHTPKEDGYTGLGATNTFRFRTLQGKVKIDNFKIYLDKNQTVLTDVAPAYGATNVKASAPLVFTYNEFIGDASNVKLTIKPSDTNEATVLTNGNGMSVNVENNIVKVLLDNALNADLGYAVELSGLKDAHGTIVSPVITKFSTVADDEWTMTDITTVASGQNKVYSFKLKHQGAAKNAQVIAATYNSDGSLSSVALGDAKPVGETWTDFSVSSEYSASKLTKLFIWDSVSGMKPIFNAILK